MKLKEDDLEGGDGRTLLRCDPAGIHFLVLLFSISIHLTDDGSCHENGPRPISRFFLYMQCGKKEVYMVSMKVTLLNIFTNHR